MTLITVATLAIAAALAILVGLIVSALHADTVDSRMLAEADRIRGMWDKPDVTTPEPEPAREWPQRQTPTDIQAAYEDTMPPWPWRVLPLEPGLAAGFHRYESLGIRPPVIRPALALRTPAGAITQEFDRIVATEYATGEQEVAAA